MRSGILAGGNWLIDHVKILDTWPAQDSLANILRESASNGGAPYNILKDLARLRAPFPLSGVGLIGDDADGHRILEDCRAHGIDITQLQTTPEAATSYSDVMTDQRSGRRTFFYQRGTNALLAPEHFDFGRTTAKLFHLGYLLLLDRLDAFESDGLTGAAKVLQAARAAGLRTSLDCVSDNSNRFKAVAAPALPHVDYFFANDFEATQLTGISLLDDAARDPAALKAAAQRLLEAGVKTWVFIHSPHGVWAANAHESLWQPAVRIPPTDVKGAAGAGDALAAGILYGLHEAWPIAECLHLGVCGAAASLYDASCSGSVRPMAECLQIGVQFGYHDKLI